MFSLISFSSKVINLSDFHTFAQKIMKKILFLLPLCCMVAMGLLAQNPTVSDTLIKKTLVVTTDTTIKVAPAVTHQQEKPAKANTRKDTRPLKDRIDFDLGTGFWINPSQVFGELSFLVSYRFPKILSIGTGPTYIFNYQRDSEKNLNGWGGKVFARAQLLKFFYLWTEYQGISNQYITDFSPLTTDREYVDSWFLGAGVNIRLGRRFGINMSVLYDILHDSSSPYYSATTYRVGFSF
jgi:hypothetical protein